MSIAFTIPVSATASNAVDISAFAALGVDVISGLNGGNALFLQYATSSGGPFGFALKYNDSTGSAIELAQSTGGFAFVDQIPPGPTHARLWTFSPVTSATTLTGYGR